MQAEIEEWLFLEMKPNSRVDLDNLRTPNARPHYEAATKALIDIRAGWPQWYLEFSCDNRYIYKRSI